MSDRRQGRAAATEVGRQEVSGDLVPHAKEIGYNSVHEEKSLQAFK